MAAPASSSLFRSLGNLWRLLALRSDIDDIILELLGHFSLEKIYAESDKEAYQHLVAQLLAQLNAIFHIQRLTLPSENLQTGWYLGFLASWEVTLRSVEFVLQLVLEGRDSLWEAQSLRDKYLAEVLLSALRLLTLHPKALSNQRANDRRERFARIHRSLERIYGSYPGPKSFLLLVCKEITDVLRSEPNALQLPPRLKYELPNLASEMYPLTECLTSQHVSTMVPQDGFSNEWLSQFLALRDVSLFVVGASIQYHVNRETREVKLQSASAQTRTAVVHALENLRMPSHLSKEDLISTFCDTFRIILPDTPTQIRRTSTDSLRDENEMDAVDALCVRLLDRQIVHRVSDNEMMHGVSEITRKIAQLDDPGGQYRATHPRLYVFNCGSCHFAGDSQLRYSENIKFSDSGEGGQIPLTPKTSCSTCGEPVSMVREIAIVRQAWELLKPLDSNADTIIVERHLPTQFTLSPPKAESGSMFTPGYGNILAGHSSGQRSQDVDPISQQHVRAAFQTSISEDRARSVDASLLTPGPSSPGFNKRVETPRTEFSSENFTSSDSATHVDTHKPSDAQSVTIGVMETPFSPNSVGMIRPPQSQPPPSRDVRERSGSASIAFDPVPVRSQTMPANVPTLSQPERGKNRWRSKLSRSKKEASKTFADNSSISSSTLESQRLEEIPLKILTNLTKSSRGGKSSKSINVSLSQNSTHALFWTQPLIHILDIGPSPPNLIRAVKTESTCVLAAITKTYLAYIIGTRDQKLTLRIMNLVQPSATIIEYRMSTSPWCKSIAISPKDNYVVIGFENSLVRFFKTTNTEARQEDRLHPHHEECKECSPVDTLSFSNDGLVLLAGTRSPKMGTIQIYAWRFPFLSFQELSTCRYRVPLHESEDNGISSAIFRSGGAGPGAEQNLICITTWTQSGVPVLIQPEDNHRSEIRSDISTHQGRLGSRIQCAAFSPSGRELAMVNEKGHLYQINSLNSSPMDIRRIATSRELTAKSEYFAMTYMTLPDEDAIILAWADSAKSVGYVKKIPMKFNPEIPQTPSLMHSMVVEASAHASRAELDGEENQIHPPVELNSPMESPRAETPNMIDKLMEEVKGHRLMKRGYR